MSAGIFSTAGPTSRQRVEIQHLGKKEKEPNKTDTDDVAQIRVVFCYYEPSRLAEVWNQTLSLPFGEEGEMPHLQQGHLAYKQIKITYFMFVESCWKYW